MILMICQMMIQCKIIIIEMLGIQEYLMLMFSVLNWCKVIHIIKVINQYWSLM